MALTAPENAEPCPVYDGYFADPFVWQHEGVYYAIGTGAGEAAGSTSGNIFPILRSENFVDWRPTGDALIPPDPRLGDTFWAPEVAYEDGAFYLYYSVGHGDRCHQLRVARSAAPQGPYVDLGTPLLDATKVPFAIDPHPFRDADGQRYLFYACDFLDCSHGTRAGTALSVCRMISMKELNPSARVVLRARSDWQRFQNPRSMYGSIWDWHTLEGPCVVRHDNRYYCFYSGGRWENETYGVDYGVSNNVLGPYSDAGNESGPRVLRTRPGKWIGPGHNSWVVGPDGNEYLVFHAWNAEMTLRRMFIARLDWTLKGPRVGQMEPAEQAS